MGESGIKVTSSLQSFPTGWASPTFTVRRNCNLRLYKNTLGDIELKYMFWICLLRFPHITEAPSITEHFICPAEYFSDITTPSKSCSWEMGVSPISQMRRLSLWNTWQAFVDSLPFLGTFDSGYFSCECVWSKISLIVAHRSRPVCLTKFLSPLDCCCCCTDFCFTFIYLLGEGLWAKAHW